MTGQTPRRIGITIFLGLLFAIALALVLTPDGAEAQTDPPSTGDWDIYDSTTLSNGKITVPGNLNIYSGGSLTLTDVDLMFNDMSWGSKAFRVRNNAQLTMTGGSITHSSIGYSYKFVIENGATVSMDGVTVKHTWHDERTYRRTQDLAGGMQIRSHTVTLINCTFTEQVRVAMTINNANPKITNCTFLKTHYYTYEGDDRYNYYYYREAIGIMIINGAPEITGCTFNEMGDYVSAFNDAADSSYTYLYLNGHGIYSIQGAPKIKECIFTEIGRIHTSYSYRVFVEKVDRYVYFYMRQDYNEFRGAIHAIDPIMLEVFDCNFTHNYEGYYYYTNQAYGVYQDDGKSSIKGNVFWTNGGGGVYLNNADALLKDNEMYDFYYYGLYINGNGVISAQNNTWNGTAEQRNIRSEEAVRITNGGRNIDLRLNRISFCLRAFYVQYTNIVSLYDTLITNSSNKIYAYGARVDCYNVTVTRGEIDLGYIASEVNIYWDLDVKVTWQNGVPIPSAIVQIFNESNGLLKANQVNDKGRMPTLTMLQTKITGTSQSKTTIVNSPLKVSAYANAIDSRRYTIPFDKNTFFVCIVEDLVPPNVEIYAPPKNHAQNETTLRLAGIAVDVGSGLDGVEVSADEGSTWHRATGGLTWNLSIAIPEGNHDIQVRGIDIAGGISLYHIKNVTIDLTDPWLIITTPAKNNFYTNETTVTIIGQAEIGANVYLNGEELSTNGGSFFAQLVNQQEGLNTYEMMAVDLVGNRNITLLNIFQDITSPILLVEYPPEEHVTNDRVLVISGLTEQDVVVTIDGLVVVVENGLFTLPMTLREGLNVIELQAVDQAKNYRVRTLLVTYDITPPEVDMLFPQGDGAVNKSTITVAGDVEADVEQVRINQVPVAIKNGRFSKGFKLSEGDNLILVEVTDHAGNSINIAYALTLDTNPPELVMDGPLDGTYVTKETVLVSGRAEVGATVTLNGEEVPNSGGFFSVEALLVETMPGDDPNTLVVMAMDVVGNYVEVELHVYRDTSAPGFTVYDTPSSTINDFINITGGVEDVTDIHEMTFNEMRVQPTAKGYFEAYVPLEMGLNVFTITARDLAGNEYTQQVSIEREPQKISDTGFMGLGDSAWLIMVLCLVVGLFTGLAVLYLLERRKGVDV